MMGTIAEKVPVNGKINNTALLNRHMLGQKFPRDT